MDHNFGSRTLRFGSTGDDVLVLQYLLNYLPASITGPDLNTDAVFGSLTRAAVRMFQSYFRLSSDGIVGTNTFLYLGQPTGSFAAGTVFGSRTLRKGLSGRDVWILQNRLASTAKKYALALGGPADSIFGPKTEAAVKLFQADMGIAVDGIVGDRTLFLLYLHTYMGGRLLQRSRSDRNQGIDVFFLQNKLKDEKFYSGALDGKFGPLTEAAVKKFQAAAGITVDGIVGSVTYWHLDLTGV
jgi:peptidoglycan hydrolase-like protein with peptidoglycan-binding domain